MQHAGSSRTTEVGAWQPKRCARKDSASSQSQNRVAQRARQRRGRAMRPERARRPSFNALVCLQRNCSGFRQRLLLAWLPLKGHRAKRHKKPGKKNKRARAHLRHAANKPHYIMDHTSRARIAQTALPLRRRRARIFGGGAAESARGRSRVGRRRRRELSAAFMTRAT